MTKAHPTIAARDRADPERAALTELRRTHGRDLAMWPEADRARWETWVAACLARKAERVAERVVETVVEEVVDVVAERVVEAVDVVEKAVDRAQDAFDASRPDGDVPPVETYLKKRGRKVRRG